MTSTPRRSDNDGVDAAINRVLRREREAREAVAECRRQAEARLAAARARAQRIEARGERREQAMRVFCDRAVERAIAELLRPPTASSGTLSADQEGRIDEAVEQLCEEILTGR